MACPWRSQQPRDDRTVHAAATSPRRWAFSGMKELPCWHSGEVCLPVHTATASINSSTCSSVLDRPSENRMLARARSRAESHSEQDMRRLNRAARASRAARYGEAPKVERNHQRLAARRRRSRGWLYWACAASGGVDSRIRYPLENSGLEPVAECASRGFAGQCPRATLAACARAIAPGTFSVPGLRSRSCLPAELNSL